MLHNKPTSRVDTKTEELVIYLLNKGKSKSNFGATLLNKALYFIDNTHYLKTGTPISSFKYHAQDFGPTPNPYQFLSLKDDLLERDVVTQEEGVHFGRILKRLSPNRPANIAEFTADEIDLINSVFDEVCEWNAKEISDITHNYPSWKAADSTIREELPFHTFLLTSQEPSKEDIEWAKSVIGDA